MKIILIIFAILSGLAIAELDIIAQNLKSIHCELYTMNKKGKYTNENNHNQN